MVGFPPCTALFAPVHLLIFNLSCTIRILNETVWCIYWRFEQKNTTPAVALAASVVSASASCICKRNIGMFFNPSILFTLKYLIIVHVRIINFWVTFHPVWAYSLLYVYWFLRFCHNLVLQLHFKNEMLSSLINNCWF